MCPAIVKTFRIRKRHLAGLASLVFLGFILAGIIEARLEKQSMAAMSWSVASKVIVVDPGHGGVDPGVVGKSGALEKDISLAVSKRLAANLGQAGAMVLMTRESDTDLSEPGTLGLMAKKREDLKKRVALANDNKADLYVSVHVNSFPDPSRRGAQTFVQHGSAESVMVAGFIQSELARVLKNTDRIPREVDYYITRHSNVPTVIVEIGFITNETEEKLLQDSDYQAKVAWAIHAGVVKYFAKRDALPHGRPDKENLIKTFKEHVPSVVKDP